MNKQTWDLGVFCAPGAFPPFDTEEAFERRLDIAMSSAVPGEVMDQIADLETPEDTEIRDQKRKHFDVNYDPSARADSEYMVNIFAGKSYVTKQIA